MKFQAPSTKYQTNSKRVRKFIAFCLCLLLFSALPVLAVKEATPSSTEEIKEKIKQRLEKTATASAESLEDTKKGGKYFAWVGTLIRVEGQSLFIQTDKGEKEAVTEDETVVLQTEKTGKRAEVDSEKLKEGNFIIAMGLAEGEKIIAKRVISTPPVEISTQKKVIFGKVAEIEEGKITLQNSQENILLVDKNTSLTIKGAEKGKLVDIQIEDKLYAIVVQEDGKIVGTKDMFVIPGKYSPEKDDSFEMETKKKLEEVSPATPSAETASPASSTPE